MKRSGKQTRSKVESLYSLLYQAVLERSLPGVERLLEEGADPGVKDSGSFGWSPLHTAVCIPEINPLIVASFVKWNRAPQILNHEGLTPLMLGLTYWRSVDEEKIHLLFSAGCKCSWTEWEDIRDKSISFHSVSRLLSDSEKSKLQAIEHVLKEYCLKPRSLKDLCCIMIRELLGTNLQQLVPLLPLPEYLRRFVALEQILNNVTSVYKPQSPCGLGKPVCF